jgi:serine/threonine-protein kinase HipA
MWGSTIGAVSLAEDSATAVFQYDPAFVGSGVEPSPLTMPLRRQPYVFPELAVETFRSLPGLLADALPDRYGNALIDAWLAAQGRSPDDFDVVERLCYIGRRGMGALEFAPARGPRPRAGRGIDIGALVELASEVLTQRERFVTSLREHGVEGALRDILMVGTSAGGARAKAVIAWNPATNVVRSGQVDAEPGFEHWLLKFDGVSDETREIGRSQGYGAIEYAYSLMARDAGIEMSSCRLLAENGRRHFMTRRFDRPPEGGKLHMQSLGALAHFDFNLAGGYAYEQALQTIRQLGLPMEQVEQQFRRMTFNIVARNQDDHVKNIAFLMDRRGSWRLSPAFDVAYAYAPEGRQTRQHQMSVNGKRDDFVFEDLRRCAASAVLARGRAEAIFEQVREAVRRWPERAAEAGVFDRDVERIARVHRLELPRR